MQGSTVGSTLRQRSAAVILGQGLCKSLFIHAGLPLQLLLQVLQQLSRQEPIDILDKLNLMLKGKLMASNDSFLLLVGQHVPAHLPESFRQCSCKTYTKSVH